MRKHLQHTYILSFSLSFSLSLSSRPSYVVGENDEGVWWARWRSRARALLAHIYTLTTNACIYAEFCDIDVCVRWVWWYGWVSSSCAHLHHHDHSTLVTMTTRVQVLRTWEYTYIDKHTRACLCVRASLDRVFW